MASCAVLKAPPASVASPRFRCTTQADRLAAIRPRGWPLHRAHPAAAMPDDADHWSPTEARRVPAVASRGRPSAAQRPRFRHPLSAVLKGLGAGAWQRCQASSHPADTSITTEGAA